MNPYQIGFAVLCLAVAVTILLILAKHIRNVEAQPTEPTEVDTDGNPIKTDKVEAPREFHSNTANMNAPWKVICRH